MIINIIIIIITYFSLALAPLCMVWRSRRCTAPLVCLFFGNQLQQLVRCASAPLNHFLLFRSQTDSMIICLAKHPPLLAEPFYFQIV